ncbi:MAG: helix-turn-helix domain-containing protein [Clostridia bacterium]|nr:helix-turn-helix domain-containing protein [Clostridia bacterium]
MIGLGEKIRALRQKGGRTQEALANALGVTAQAVSRWEKEICYPDLEAIPSIANYFGISIDELFGYENERTKRIDALAERIGTMNRENNGKDVSMDTCIALAREALIEFPGNEKLTLALASALYNAGYVRYGEFHLDGEDGCSVYDSARHRTYSEWREAIRLYEKLLPALRDGEPRQRAVTELAQLYKNTGEHEKALQLAESAPEIASSRPFLRIKAFDGKDAVAACGEALLETVQKSAELIVHIVLSDGTIPAYTKAELLQSAEGMFHLICPDGCCGREFGLLSCIQLLHSHYLWLADDRDGAFAALDQALSYAARLDALPGCGMEFFTSPLLKRVRLRADRIPPGSAFRNELPEVWPWWDASGSDKVRSEMQLDPRWAEWVGKTKEA